MLPYIEQNPLYLLYMRNQLSLQATSSTLQVGTLNCPSRNPTNSPAPCSYIVNCGMTDYNAGPPSNMQPQDNQANGIFFDAYAPVRYSGSPLVTTDIAYLNKHDGNSQTLMLSENTEALDWIATLNASGSIATPTTPVQPAPQQYTPPQLTQLYGNMIGDCWWQGFVWHVTITPEVGGRQELQRTSS